MLLKMRIFEMEIYLFYIKRPTAKAVGQLRFVAVTMRLRPSSFAWSSALSASEMIFSLSGA